MKFTSFIPGPSQLYPTVPHHIRNAVDQQILSWSHRSEDFRQLCENTVQRIKEVMAAPGNVHVFFLGSATEAMERIIQNTVERRSFHLVNGSFSKRFYTIASQLGKEPEKLDAEPGKPFDFDRACIPNDVELLCFTHNETSMGIRVNMDDIRHMKQQHPDALVAVDVVSSAPCVDLDWRIVDCAFFSVQKCFGSPAGLGVLIVNDSALEKSKNLEVKGISIGSYHSFTSLLEEAKRSQTPETPNVLGIYLLGKVCEDFLESGIDVIKKRTEEHAALLYDFFEAHPVIRPFVEDPRARSQTVVVAQTPGGSKRIISSLKRDGFVIGSGYGTYKDTHIRIANFPAHSTEDLQNVINKISQLDVDE